MGLLIDGVAIVTGAASGIGKECCLAFAAEGARALVLADINHNAALEVARESESLATNPEFKTLAIAVDVADAASVNQMVDAAVKAFGRIDYSVNSAGVGVQKPLPIGEADTAEMNRFWQVNVMGTFNCVQAVTQAMKNQSTRKIAGRGQAERDVGRGVILNLGSCNSYWATPNIVQYTTAKHAVIGLTRNAALDNARHAIRVNAICPGWVDTPMVSAAIAGDDNLPKMMKAVIPMSRIASPEEIADVVMFMVSPRSSYVTGVGWIADGGTTLQVQGL
ncbi:short-chain dehydrogenase/reductase SDR [Nemania sp. FL0031]|nr:short-chain dehydrogenase/reductase SDR [Nemania sp. FL0031]